MFLWNVFIADWDVDNSKHCTKDYFKIKHNKGNLIYLVRKFGTWKKISKIFEKDKVWELEIQLISVKHLKYHTVGIWAYYMAKNSYKDLAAFFRPFEYADQKNMKEKKSHCGFLRAALLRAKISCPLG